ncbi:hypothetical protein BXY82_1706 [Gelidibacter sediminis]|uniref:Uncharacterized protein n=1 Tax=Gelidibacter sediminis TaxID=1608710 RepID=A0A4V3F8A9_9FLAO|nr:hypothetical protein BXY82_1706 [Gelidibacter sediminis]
MMATNLLGMANFLVKGKKASMVLIGVQLAYLIYKYQKDKKAQLKRLKAKF